jgi:predicted Zn-dependent protease
MSSYSSKIIIIFIVIFVTSCSIRQYSVKTPEQTLKENIIISMALDLEYTKQYTQSAELYNILLQNNPNSYEYFAKNILLNRLLKNNTNIQKLTLNYIDNFSNKYEQIMQEYIIASVNLKQYKKALNSAKKLLKKYNNAKNYTIIADIYLLQKDYQNSSVYYESAYFKNHDADVLLSLTNILYTYLNKKTEAIAYLETHHRLYKCREKVCIKLLRYYEAKQNYNGMLSITKTLYNKFKKRYTNKELLKIKKLIVNLYIKIDIKKAIKFLENNSFDDQKLLNLYAQEDMYQKALNLTKKIYKKTKDDKYLGQIAILEYELDKDKYMQNIIYNFEKSLKNSSNDIYENYYGFILVDHNIDIKKGLKLIQKAYSKYPNNLAYKDSLAYAFYKNKNCNRAYNLMNDIVKQIGLKNQEIKTHWEQIKTCKEQN